VERVPTLRRCFSMVHEGQLNLSVHSIPLISASECREIRTVFHEDEPVAFSLTRKRLNVSGLLSRAVIRGKWSVSVRNVCC
jgi:hypothetical protein